MADSDYYYLGNPKLPKKGAQYDYISDGGVKANELAKCTSDLEHFASNYFYIISAETGKRSVIELHPFQRRIVRGLMSNRHYIMCASRQVGKTTLYTIYALWKACFFEEQKILIVANKEATAQEIFSRIRMAYEELPNWLKPGIDDNYGKTSMKLANGSEILICATSSSGARGMSVTVLMMDEMAFIDQHLIDDFWKSMYPAITAKKSSNILIASTPNGDDNKFHDMFQNAKGGGTNYGWSEIMWDEVPDRDSKWKKDTIEEGGLSDDDWKQEFCCWFKPTAASSFNKEEYEDLLSKSQDSLWTSEDGHYRIFKEAENGSILSVGVDVSEGLGIDASAIKVNEFIHGFTADIREIAVYENDTISPIDFTRVLYDILIEWGSPLVFIERNGPGAAVIDLLHSQYKYENIVDWGGKKAKRKKGSNHQKGMISHTNTKYHAVANMRYWNGSAKSTTFYDLQTIEQMKNFKKQKSGKWECTKGHDDLVTSCMWGLMIAHNEIAERYFTCEIDPTTKRVTRLIAPKYTYNDARGKSNSFQRSKIEPIVVNMSNVGLEQSGVSRYNEEGWMTLDQYAQDSQNIQGNSFGAYW